MPYAASCTFALRTGIGCGAALREMVNRQSLVVVREPGTYGVVVSTSYSRFDDGKPPRKEE